MNRTTILAAGLLALAASTGAVLAQTASDSVCLITFGTVEDALAGADATALSGVYLTREEADAQAAASGGLSVTFDYSAQYPDNADEQAFCEGPTFNPGGGDDSGGDDGEQAANPNAAKAFAPGQLKSEGESAKEHAPGHQDGPAKDSAPGQQKKNGQ